MSPSPSSTKTKNSIAAGPPPTASSGLQEGYSAAQWGPWRSHGLLLQQCIRQLKWQDNATTLLKLMGQYAATKPHLLDRGEFTRLLEDHSVLDDDGRIGAQQLWDVFDRDQDGLLSETDLLAGLIAVDPFTPHDIEAPSGMLRMQFIFLYFDEDRNGQLDLKETTALVMRLRQLREGESGQEGSSCTLRGCLPAGRL
ncbi:hypothetical protein FOZ63_030026 [Perkinsus olseni]|uniref:EF-hand domain-containing protein n=1 Tax=Perkinsus olseni TaxID=32597 RepID=A0A7J6RJ35_PEROL|nr:hypothetical protein FOZ63_030026 [Perkinsus olseni]